MASIQLTAYGLRLVKERAAAAGTAAGGVGVDTARPPPEAEGGASESQGGAESPQPQQQQQHQQQQQQQGREWERRATATRSQIRSPPLLPRATHAFDQELVRRRTALLFYLLRGPCFNRYVQSTCSSARALSLSPSFFPFPFLEESNE